MPATAGEQSYETEVINNISIGDISISLSVNGWGTHKDGMGSQDRRYVLPGETVENTVRITNLANPAWIRLRLTYDPEDGMKDFPASCIIPADEHWIERGEFYYYTLPLGSGEEVEFMREMLIPPFWGREAEGKDFELMITAEAVQEANFIPDFTLDDPWFGTLIETCVHTSHEPMMLSFEDFSVSFEGGAEGLVRIGDDLFGNFGVLMPGDTGSGTVVLKNEYSRPIGLYFRTEGQDDGPLANEARLMIRCDEELIYDGRLSGSREEVQIAWLERGDEKVLTYSIFIPPECGNSYAVSKAADKWIFRAALNVDEEKPYKHSSGGGGSHSKGSGTVRTDAEITGPPGPAAESVPYTGNLAMTGEGRGMLIALIIMTVSGMILAAAFRRCHKSRRSGPGRGGVR